MTDIFERMRSGELIHLNDPDYDRVYRAIARAFSITGKLNSSYHDENQTRDILSELTGEQIDKTTCIIAPFYTDFGQFTRFGKNVFVNFGCSFMDRGGITIEDGVLIGPDVKLITENHAVEPELRRSVYSTPIVIKQGAWIGAGAMILPGVTIGKNAIVGAASVVTKDVPDNTVVAGNSARIIKTLSPPNNTVTAII